MSTKITELPAATSAASADVFPFVIVSGSPTTSKITLANLGASMPISTLTQAAIDALTASISAKPSLGETSSTAYRGDRGKIAYDFSQTATTVGAAFVALTNPGAITFLRVNANNTVSALNAADFKTALSITTFDPANPGNIGTGTPGTGVFTVLAGSTGVIAGDQFGGYVTSGTHRAQINATATQTPLFISGGSGSIEVWKDRDLTNGVAFGAARPGGASGNDFVFSTYSGQWTERMRIVSSDGSMMVGSASSSDTRLSIGAVSGTGGGVLSLQQIVTPPTPIAEKVQFSYDGTFWKGDRPIDVSGGAPKFATATTTKVVGVDAPDIFALFSVGGTQYVFPGYVTS